ncbi:MAG: hypothetical protein ACR2RB_12050 [Gammaproteobacteria bacterium]
MSDEIKTTSGNVVGQWDGRDVNDLRKELDRVKVALRQEGSSDRLTRDGIPHADQFPDDLKAFTPYILWGCDVNGVCLVGSGANRTETVDAIREFYGNDIAKDAIARHGPD